MKKGRKANRTVSRLIKEFETRYKKKDPKKGSDAFQSEREYLIDILEKIVQKLGRAYSLKQSLGMGSSGLVIKVRDNNLKFDRALKLPRPKPEEKGGKFLIESLKNESEHLRTLAHDNIIKVYRIDSVPISIDKKDIEYPFFIMDYVKKPRNLGQVVNDRIKKIDLRNSDCEKELQTLLSEVSVVFYKISLALVYLHSKEVIHFDIKPDNILIDERNKPLLADLGFAKKKTNSEADTVVGFTLFYAHPDLRDEYTTKESEGRTKTEKKPKDFQYAFDSYSFGISVLDILDRIYAKFKKTVEYNYTFTYLHLSACRMLDGRNRPNANIDALKKKLGMRFSCYKQTWSALKETDFEQIKYTNFKNVSTDLEKLLGQRNILDLIPELSIYFPKRMICSAGISSPFSTRIKEIVEHPVFLRLFDIHQVNLLRYIYPTATHTKMEHAIGSFRNCCLYIQSLYNDPYNPLFKQFINEEDIKSVLLASLLDELGQYPLAYELSEIHSELKYKNFTPKFLHSKKKNHDRKTLKEIINKLWGVDIERIVEILNTGTKPSSDPFIDLKNRMLSSIVDGPIDVDKLDYLTRDSQNCYLKHADLIDHDKLINNLTIVVKEEGGKPYLTMGIYEDGQYAAESVTFTRYLLFQSLYWHHTARAIHIMLRQSLAPILKKGKSLFVRKIEKHIGAIGEFKKTNTNDMLAFIKAETDKNGKTYIQMINDRNYYKRLLTITDQDDQKKLGKIDNYGRKLEAMIIKEYIKSIVDDIEKSKVNRKIHQIKIPIILVDLLEPNHLVGMNDKFKLIFMPEPKIQQRNYDIRFRMGEKATEKWHSLNKQLMEMVAKGRVFCHPNIRDDLIRVLGPEGIQRCITTLTEKR